MNAYELADALQETEPYYSTDYKLFDNAAKMLRQQADRIAELENQSQPVAWMEYIQDEEWEVWYTKPTDLPEGHSYKPLYLAPQTKPLSNDEILEMTIWNKNLYELYVEMEKEDMIAFARAIEERHGIK